MGYKTSMTFFITVVSSILFFSIPNTSAEEKEVFTLNKSIAEAIENSWTLKAKGETIDQSINVKKQARSEFLPKVGMTYGYTRLSEEPIPRGSFSGIPQVADTPAGTQDIYQWRGTVTQPLFAGFALISSYQLAKLGIDQSEMDYELEKLDLALKVKEAYFDILIADKAVEVAQKEVEARDSSVNVAQSFYEVGMIPVNDLLKAEVELANTRQILIKARNDAKLARSAFNIVLSRPINVPVEVEDILSLQEETYSFDELLDQALKIRPEIKLVNINISQVGQQIRLAQSKYYPEVSFSYNYIKEGDEPNVSGSDFQDAGRWEVMAQASWNLWEWGRTHYSVQEKEAVMRELVQTRSALEDSIRLELKKAMLDMETAEENIPSTKKAVEQGEENLRVNQERYKAQVTTITEVLDAQTLLSRARVNYYTAVYTHHLAKAGLLRALGTY